ncbi:MAG: hypothetical protein GQ467_01225 [Mariprofundaceae bacterium]|nr:hypothetical protein [Mariprofundaceae bacterium]
MNELSKDAGVLAVLLQRLEKERLPIALTLKEKVDSGETLGDSDLAFLEKVLSDTNRIKPLIKRHPEHHSLAAKMISLYSEITKKAVENEKRA